MVRLKSTSAAQSSKITTAVSIPNGSIKIPPDAEPESVNTIVSIPNGSIKICVRKVRQHLSNVSIPNGSIKITQYRAR